MNLTDPRRLRIAQRPGLAVAGLVLPLFLLPAPARACTGDCDGNGRVAINELIQGVNISLGNSDVSACQLMDTDGNGAVAINELIQAVNNSLNGCALTPTDTAEPTATSTATSPPATDTPEATATATGTETLPAATGTTAPTATSTSTATSPPATDTPEATATATATDTPTPTPTATEEPQPLGVRVFSIAEKPSSEFWSSGLGIPGGFDVSRSPFFPGPLLLVAGVPDGDGIAPLSLQEDAIFGWKVLDQSVVCIRVIAEGSGGSIDCDGGSPHDVVRVQESNGADPEDPAVVNTGMGGDGGAGAATLTVMQQYAQLQAGLEPDECAAEAIFEAPQPTAYTTRSATSQITGARPGSLGAINGGIILTQPGANFDCDTWTTENSAGKLAGPLVGFDTVVGDVANLIVIADN